MRAAVAFDDLLDERLAGGEPQRRQAPSPHPAGTAATYGFFFGLPPAELGVRVRGAAASNRPTDLRGPLAAPRNLQASFVRAVTTEHSHRPRATRFSPEEPDARAPVASRRLTRRQRQALDAFQALGVSLRADFTPDQLRSAFRELARRYHPDRHAGCSERDKALLANLFGHAHDAYRVLLKTT